MGRLMYPVRSMLSDVGFDQAVRWLANPPLRRPRRVSWPI